MELNGKRKIEMIDKKRRKPDFIIAGTQKSGTTWLEKNLLEHPQFYTPRKQLHYFDKNYDKGFEWYTNHFLPKGMKTIYGEKTTEYFDTLTAEIFAQRLNENFSQTKVIVILRNPIDRAFSALGHMVRSGLEAIPLDPDELLFKDLSRPEIDSYRYIERGYYSSQLKSLLKFIDPSQLLVLILEEDIIDQPKSGMESVVNFLGGDNSYVFQNLDKPVNKLRLSRSAIILSRKLSEIPYSKSFIRRIDKALYTHKWKVQFSNNTRNELALMYKESNKELFEILKRPMPTHWVNQC